MIFIISKTSIVRANTSDVMHTVYFLIENATLCTNPTDPDISLEIQIAFCDSKRIVTKRDLLKIDNPSEITFNDVRDCFVNRTLCEAVCNIDEPFKLNQ